MSSPVVGRFAPTPSGKMHLGNVFAALLCWLSARSQGGRVVLRVEDLDLVRTSPAYTESILRDLAWLGLSWDEGPEKGGAHGPYWQSQRTAFYEEQLGQLKALGLVYPCFCSRAELHAATAPHASDGSYVYSGRCRALTPEQAAQNTVGRAPALRVRVPDEVVGFTDGCQGYYEENLANEAGDFILRRSDGVFAYQLAAPADDGAMGITEVVRGRDLLSSAPRQIWLLRTLGYTPPRYCHHPLLLAADGRRLSKRDKDVDLSAIQGQVPQPEPLLGTLAYLAGLLPQPQAVSAAQLVPLFSWQKVRREDITMPLDFWEMLQCLSQKS